jgi:hypothetical protein
VFVCAFSGVSGFPVSGVSAGFVLEVAACFVSRVSAGLLLDVSAGLALAAAGLSAVLAGNFAMAAGCFGSVRATRGFAGRSWSKVFGFAAAGAATWPGISYESCAERFSTLRDHAM